MPEKYWLNVRDKPAFMHAVMRVLAGGAHISFEGDLSGCRGVFQFDGASTEETPVLRRNTLSPVLDFVVLPLEPENVAPILQEIGGNRLVHEVVHIQIEKHRVLHFGSYDNFHPDGCVVWFGAAESSLQELKFKGILRSYEKVPNKPAGERPLGSV